MADISMCSGHSCDGLQTLCLKRDKCYRYTAKPNPYRQSYLILEEIQDCKHFWDNAGRYNHKLKVEIKPISCLDKAIDLLFKLDKEPSLTPTFSDTVILKWDREGSTLEVEVLPNKYEIMLDEKNVSMYGASFLKEELMVNQVNRILKDIF